MPRVLVYPTISFEKALELADVVYQIGGYCRKEACAKKMELSISGYFQTLLSSAVKFQLIIHKKGRLSTTKIYENIRLSYTDSERINYLQLSFFSIPLFRDLYNTYRDDKLPEDIFEKVLVKEYDVDAKDARAVSRNFVQGAKTAGLLNADSTFNSIIQEDLSGKEIYEASGKESKPDCLESCYEVSIKGPRLSLVMNIYTLEDLNILKKYNTKN